MELESMVGKGDEEILAFGFQEVGKLTPRFSDYRMYGVPADLRSTELGHACFSGRPTRGRMGGRAFTRTER